MTVTPEARRLFAVVVDKCPDVLGPDFRSREVTDVLALAAAALCAGRYTNKDTRMWYFGGMEWMVEKLTPQGWTEDWFAFPADPDDMTSVYLKAILAEKGIEHE